MIARLIISNSIEERLEEIKRLLTETGLKNPHPDLLFFDADSKLGILEARKIKEHFSLKPYSAKGRVAIAEDASKLTPDAQNALLKTLEELPEEGMIILGADSESKFLPTVLSRIQVTRLQGTVNSKKDYAEEIDRLLKADTAERFEFVEKLKDKHEFLVALLEYFRNQLPLHKDFVKELLQAEEWAKSNVNIRGILEYLMLVMPVD